MVGSGWNRENPTRGYDHWITASTFLPFSGIFPQDPTCAFIWRGFFGHAAMAAR
jgi:hypothetical protein